MVQSFKDDARQQNLLSSELEQPLLADMAAQHPGGYNDRNQEGILR